MENRKKRKKAKKLRKWKFLLQAKLQHLSWQNNGETIARAPLAKFHGANAEYQLFIDKKTCLGER